jgi:hypothetical protein
MTSLMTKPPMVMRSHRFPAALYNAAKAKADDREENISDVLREALERYALTDVALREEIAWLTDVAETNLAAYEHATAELRRCRAEHPTNPTTGA